MIGLRVRILSFQAKTIANIPIVDFELNGLNKKRNEIQKEITVKKKVRIPGITICAFDSYHDTYV
jgi:seryl-tRNA synthetase